jgi:hypothetical protein
MAVTVNRQPGVTFLTSSAGVLEVPSDLTREAVLVAIDDGRHAELSAYVAALPTGRTL